MRLFSKLQSGDETILNNEELSLTEFDNCFRNNYKIIAGTDEAGRGALAGPVVSAAVILKENFNYGKMNDSKQLKQPQREEYFELIKNNAVSYAYSVISAAEVDRLNPLWASLTAMANAVMGLENPPDIVLIDGNKMPTLPYKSLAVVKGDARSLTVAAASIVAKVVRDKLMDEEHLKYPLYGFKDNKGYGTKKHLEALKKYGALNIHRKTFKGVLEDLKDDLKLF